MAALGRHCRQLQVPLLRVDSLFLGAPLPHTRDPVKEHNKAIFGLMHKSMINDILRCHLHPGSVHSSFAAMADSVAPFLAL